jgi:Tfp pilus assembly protein PilZ
LFLGRDVVDGDPDRRSSGLFRIPFVQQCRLRFDDATSATAFIVNINVTGAYVAKDIQPRLGQVVSCRFRIPGNELELAFEAIVVWVNPRQQHPIHSLPPGFGVRFVNLPTEVRARIESLIQEYVARNPGAR